MKEKLKELTTTEIIGIFFLLMSCQSAYFKNTTDMHFHFLLGAILLSTGVIIKEIKKSK